MEELYQNKYNEILKRFKEQNINVDGKDIIIDNSLNGQPISGFTISEDKKWFCCPMFDDEWSAFTGTYEYKPQCFEIDNMFTTYLSNGYMSYLTQIIVLKRP